ncbi:MAG TPA: STAS/SEC14 domain-containing protein [Cyclobacteriaceae bacterium]
MALSAFTGNQTQMIQELKNTPVTMVGFKSRNEITRTDFDSIMLPAAVELIQRTSKLNFLLVLDAEFESFVVGAWLKEAMIRLNHMSKWNRVAVITNTKVINSFSNPLVRVVPGEFRGFNQNELQEAIAWVSEKSIVESDQVDQLFNGNLI